MNDWELFPGMAAEPRRYSKRNDNGIQKPKRKKCAAKEKERNLAINEAFALLQHKIPHVDKERAPKIKILRLAKLYIAELMEALNAPMPCSEEAISDAFLPKVVKEMQVKNCYTHRAEEIIRSERAASKSPSPAVDQGYGSFSTGTPSSSFSTSPMNLRNEFHDYSQMPPNYSTFSQVQNQNSFFYSAPQHYQQFAVENHFFPEDSMDCDWKPKYSTNYGHNHAYNAGF